MGVCVLAAGRAHGSQRAGDRATLSVRGIAPAKLTKGLHPARRRLLRRGAHRAGTKRTLGPSSDSRARRVGVRTRKARRLTLPRRGGGGPARRGEGVEPILSEACSQDYPESAICVQKLDDSLNSAIRITYRISLRSSSVREPRYPLLRVVQRFV